MTTAVRSTMPGRRADSRRSSAQTASPAGESATSAPFTWPSSGRRGSSAKVRNIAAPRE